MCERTHTLARAHTRAILWCSQGHCGLTVSRHGITYQNGGHPLSHLSHSCGCSTGGSWTALVEPSNTQEDSFPFSVGPCNCFPIVAMSKRSEPPPQALANIHHAVNLAQQIDRYQIIPIHLHNS